MSRKKNKLHSWLGIGYLLFFVSLIANAVLFGLWQASSSLVGTYIVTEVIDGDSFVLDHSIGVRLASIDAPLPDFCYGREAQQKLEELILDKRIRYVRAGVDKFNRIVGLIYQGNLLVNKEMIRLGMARYDASGTDSDSMLQEVGVQAKQAKRGLFSEVCTQTDPPDPKCVIKGNIDDKGRIKTYHFPGCSHYATTIVQLDKGDGWFCSEKEARAAGFVKSKNCHGKEYKAE